MGRIYTKPADNITDNEWNHMLKVSAKEYRRIDLSKIIRRLKENNNEPLLGSILFEVVLDKGFRITTVMGVLHQRFKQANIPFRFYCPEERGKSIRKLQPPNRFYCLGISGKV